MIGTSSLIRAFFIIIVFTANRIQGNRTSIAFIHSHANVLFQFILTIRDKKGNVSLWDARCARDGVEEAHRYPSRASPPLPPPPPPPPPPPLLHFLRVQQEALHGVNIDMRHLVIASPTGVVVLDFWDAADVQKDVVAKTEHGANALKGDEGAGDNRAIGAHIQKLADFKETLIFK